MRSALWSLFLLGCGLPPAALEPGAAPLAPADAKLALGDVHALKAWPGGLAVVDASGHLTRYRTEAGRLEVAQAGLVVGELLDADDDGNLYVFPAGKRDSVVARLSADGAQTTVIEAGRGIWSFGISPQGRAFWSTACGPTGIFEYPGTPLKTALAPPDTLWGSQPAVLTGDRTFWSVKYGDVLVRTTPQGSAELGPVRSARLARCGAHVCGVLPGQVTEWDEHGEVLRTVPAPGSTEVLDVTGSSDGLYLLLDGPEGREVKLVR